VTGAVFVSYARDDEPFARQLRDALAHAGETAWLDVAELRAGDDWRPAVRDAIKRSVVVVFVATAASLASEQCLEELRVAVESDTPVVPVARPDDGAAALHELAAQIAGIAASDRSARRDRRTRSRQSY
jgi:hypothetical protein